MAQFNKFVCKLLSKPVTRFMHEAQNTNKNEKETLCAMTLSADKQMSMELNLGEIVMYFYLAYTRHISSDYHRIGCVCEN